MRKTINGEASQTAIRKQGLIRSEPLPDKYPAAHRAARQRASNRKTTK
ncbi:hypothetical protein [Salmonirosea aquatica]